jgi:two-component system phosphate regulon response regulator PhoB
MSETDPLPQSRPTPVRRTVLVVVADTVIRELLMVHLRDAGFVPVPAASAQEARRLAADVLPDVLLVDPDAPPTADTAFCADLAAAVLVVRLAMHADRATDSLDGATLVVRKPCVPRDLVERIMHRLDSRARSTPVSVPADVLRIGPVSTPVAT